MHKVIRQAVPFLVFVGVLWIGHAAIVDHATVVLAILTLVAAVALATLSYRGWPSA